MTDSEVIQAFRSIPDGGRTLEEHLIVALADELRSLEEQYEIVARERDAAYQDAQTAEHRASLIFESERVEMGRLHKRLEEQVEAAQRDLDTMLARDIEQQEEAARLFREAEAWEKYGQEETFARERAEATLAKIRDAANRQAEAEYQRGWLSCSWIIDVIERTNCACPACNPAMRRAGVGPGDRSPTGTEAPSDGARERRASFQDSRPS